MSTQDLTCNRQEPTAFTGNDTPSGKDIIKYMRDVIRGRNDPMFVIRDLFGITPFPEQERQIREFYRDCYDKNLPPYKRMILIAGMRSGKTAEASMIGTYEYWLLCTMDNPSKHWGLLTNQEIFITVIAPSQKQAEDGVFGNIISNFECSAWMKWAEDWIKVKPKADMIECFKFKDGEWRNHRTTLQVLGSWASTAVGRTNKCVIFDEMDTFEETSSKRGAWEVWSRLTKSTDTLGKDGHVVGITSPRTPSSIGMTLYKEGLKDARTLALMKPTWEMNPHLTEESLREEHKWNLNEFYRDYACVPSMWSGVKFPEGLVTKSMRNVLKEIDTIHDRVQETHIMAIDPAATNDAFGIACGQQLPTGKIIIDGAHKFQKIEGDKFIKPSDIRAFLDKTIPLLRVWVLIHDTWMYPDILEYVHQRYGVITIQHVVKDPDYSEWKALQGQPDRLDVVEEEQLRTEVERLIVKKAGDRPKTDHPYGGSKDIADCVANIIWFYSTDHEDIDMNPGMVITNVF